MRGYNTLLGSHYDHYHLDYDSYKHDDIPDDIFEVDQGKSCSLFIMFSFLAIFVKCPTLNLTLYFFKYII